MKIFYNIGAKGEV